MLGLAIILVIAVLAIAGPWLAPADPLATNLDATLLSPRRGHWLGTDEFGRDILSRLMAGTRVTVGMSAASLALAVGTSVPLGIAAGYYRGWRDTLLMRFVDVLLSFPGALLAIMLITVLGPGLSSVVIAVTIFSIPAFARLARGAALSLSSSDMVQAAVASGASDAQVLFHHILPNSMVPILVQASIRMGTVILTVSSLSFLGLGPQPPAPEWGAMLSTARSYLYVAPHVALAPGLATSLAIIGFILFGESLVDRLAEH
jgi:peptide/nickel transport system permease protein